jgi:hypothetical protein
VFRLPPRAAYCLQQRLAVLALRIQQNRPIVPQVPAFAGAVLFGSREEAVVTSRRRCQASSPARDTPLSVVAVAPSGRASIAFVGDQGAQIFVDDHSVGDVPSTIPAEGKQSLRISKPGFADVLRAIELPAGSSVTIPADF